MGGSATCGFWGSKDELGDGGTYPLVPPEVEPPPEPDPPELLLPLVPDDDLVALGEGDGFVGVRDGDADGGFEEGLPVVDVVGVGVGVCDGSGTTYLMVM